jgi:hypothetical protein
MAKQKRMAAKNFFAALKRRDVYEVAVAYLVVAWLLIQAASIFFPTFDAPAWGMKAFIIAIVAGFPIVLVLSWAFEKRFTEGEMILACSSPFCHPRVFSDGFRERTRLTCWRRHLAATDVA